MKVRTDGGAPVRIAPNTDRPAGAAWAHNGTIIFATVRGLFRVPDGGGEPELLASPVAERGERLYAWPALLPDQTSVLFSVFSATAGVAPQIAQLDLQTLERSTVMVDAAAAQFVPSGHLVYAARELARHRVRCAFASHAGQPTGTRRLSRSDGGRQRRGRFRAS